MIWWHTFALRHEVTRTWQGNFLGAFEVLDCSCGKRWIRDR